MSLDITNLSHIHFIGIGGISMSALAEIMITKKYKVTGSDVKDSPLVNKLKNKGVKIFIGHDAKNIKGADLVVYTSAIGEDNPEFVAATKNNIKLMDRATFLGQLMKEYKNSIAVSGTHGKTTTTGMIATIINDSFKNATMLVGGELDAIGGNIKIGGNDLILTEACEYKGNFLKFLPNIGIILNIEEDHLDYFKDIDHIKDTFTNFSNLLPEDGYLIINNDDNNTHGIINSSTSNVLAFGMDNKSDYMAKNITFNKNGFPTYTLVTENGEYDVNLNVVGLHNIYNSLAAIASCDILDIPTEKIINSLKSFKGTHRRQEHKGNINGIEIIDDYAHHPTEIKATLKALGNINYNNIWCVFQPHTYTRTKALLDEFSTSFENVDKLIITDIYAAREKDNGLVHSTDLVDKLKSENVDAIYISAFSDIKNYLLEKVQPGDLIVTMGAGSIYKVGEMVLNSHNKIKAEIR
ncbi:MAG: UDP-N-acetylmuramate--L-alanine ligase [Firmicutes bacterium]|nr:UDP-N-acetylmuramate--L-alanine ligase [Bacillota bacterium]